ncbi:MAG: hypothetical protein K2H04_05335, partial [Bacteroidaceae bacterium]|nr:hypothetical protein [Bacteroidaceae bacterium]
HIKSSPAQIDKAFIVFILLSFKCKITASLPKKRFSDLKKAQSTKIICMATLFFTTFVLRNRLNN